MLHIRAAGFGKTFLKEEAMKIPRLIVPLAAFALAMPAAAQHHHGAPPSAEASAAPGGRPSGRPAARDWTKQPVLLGKPDRNDRAAAVLMPRGLSPASVTVYAADGPAERRKTDYPAGAEGARIESAAPKVGNYHWVVAREEGADAVRVASTVWYFANPGDSPKDLLGVPKHELEIVPAPLPREHRSYREAEKWRFLVRFNGQPLAGQAVVLETEFGSRSTAVTDRGGHATVVFPRDLRPAQTAEGEGGEPRGRGRFVLATEKEEGGKRYLTAFNYTYTQDPERSRSLAWGVAFGVLGMAAATPLLRRRPQNNKGGNSNA